MIANAINRELPGVVHAAADDPLAEAADRLQALGWPENLRLLLLLRGGPLALVELAEATNATKRLVARRLGKLEALGLVFQPSHARFELAAPAIALVDWASAYARRRP